MEELIKLGDYYIDNHDYLNAINTYLKCLEISDTNYIKLKLSYLYMLIKDYETSFYYFINSYIVEDDYINIDYNLGLYLFSMLIKLPEKYLNNVKNMELEDIEILESDVGYEDIEMQNKIRTLILNQDFNAVKDYIDKDFDSNIYNLIIKKLVDNIIEEREEENKYLINLILNKYYDDILDYLESVSKYRKLNKYLEYCLKLVKDFINLSNLDSFIKVNYKTNSVYKAIDCNNYELALELEKEKCYKRKEDCNNSLLYLLLNEIVKEIKVIEMVNQEDIFDMDLGEVVELNNSKISSNLDYNLVFNNIVKYFNDNDLYNVYREIDNLLLNINNGNYRFLIIDLIKLGDLDKVKQVIKDLIANTYEFRLGEYIDYFYIALSNKNYMEARIYLDIIRNAWKLGFEFDIVADLENILNKYDSFEKIK